ncbi:MAG: tetratricopeptide repeat protein, partial [Anaerolineae bacterium]|nr:tetratricopeptide repeat protein [Anaerolineae bacterium]
RHFGAWVLAEEAPSPDIDVNLQVGTVAAGGTAIGVLIAQYVGLPVEELARKLLLRPLGRLAAQLQQPIVMVVDAVDEAYRYSGPTNIGDLLVGLSTEPNTRLVLTAHPGLALDNLVFDLEASGLLHLPIRGEEPDNLNDVRAYLQQAIGEPSVSKALQEAGLAPASFVEDVTARSEGNFLYVTSLLDAIRSGQAGLDLSTPPAGLAGYYRDQIRRLKRAAGPEWRRIYRPVLGVLSVARSPLHVGQVADLSDVDRDAVVDVIDQVRPLLEARKGAQGRPTYAWYHRATADFLLSERDNPDDWFEPQRYHAQIADRIATLTPDPALIEDEYALHNLAYHARQAGADHFPQLYALITPDVRQARRARFGSDAPFSQDLAEAIEAALEQDPIQGLPQLVRCGLIDATLSSMVTEVPPELLRELAWVGQWSRALSLAQLGTGRRGPALRAIITGLLLSDTSEGLDVARQLVGQIPAEGDDAGERARALAHIAVHLAAEGQAREAAGLFAEAATCADKVPIPDDRARVMATVARLRFASEPDAAQAGFQAAAAALAEMEVELDAGTQEAVSAANIVVQAAPESRWVVGHIPFDTVGAKARAMADVALAMAEAGAPGAQELFDQAEEVAASIPSSGIDALFGQHARDYITAQRALPSEASAQPEPATLETRLLDLSHPPADSRGFQAQVLLAMARALAQAGEEQQAQSMLQQAYASARASEGGYRARLLAQMAELLEEMGQIDLAGQWAEEARQIAGEDADLLTGYRALLAQMGTAWAADLRRVATSRVLIQKRRYYSDKALAEMAAALAERDLAEAWAVTRTIGDASQRLRAAAVVAGHLAQLATAEFQQAVSSLGLPAGLSPGDDAAVWLVRDALVSQLDSGSGVRAGDHDYLLSAAVEVLAPLAPGAALALSSDLTSLAFRAKALVDAAIGATSRGLPADLMWEQAWAATQTAPEATAALALATAQIASHWHGSGDARASEAWTRALDALRAEPSRLERIDASVLVATLMAPSRPDEAQSLLDEARRLVGDLEVGRAQGQALSRIAGAQMELDVERACRLLANLRRAGRDSFLDGLAHIIPEAVRLGGTRLIAQLATSLEEAQDFFSD